MASSILQSGLLNTNKEEGVLFESSHSFAGGLWLGGVVFLPCLSTDTQHLLLYIREEPSKEPSII
jgi:ribulose 1,5-bisphosphate synthetase/thiazole synthase